MKKYTVTAEPKQQTEGTQSSITFMLTAEGYKQAWIDARNSCRVGGQVIDPSDQDKFLDLPAGMYTVRKIFAVEKRVGRSKQLTAGQLLAVAGERGIKVNRQLRELAVELGGIPAETAVDESVAA